MSGRVVIDVYGEMPQRKHKTGESPLPPGWSEAKDVDGKVYFIDHNTQATSWIDPRDRFTKPMTFADCIGDELPFGWEEAHDAMIGSYYIDHNAMNNQIEDPREQWKEEQEIMLREYLQRGKEDLSARQDILGVKGRRLWLAQEEVDTLTTKLHQRQNGMGSKWSINSNTSFIDRYNCDELKDEIDEAKQRVSKLKSEFQSVSDEVRFQRNGIQRLEEIDKKCLQSGPFQLAEAHRIVGEMNQINQQLEFGEQERNSLLASLLELESNFVLPDVPNSQSGSVSSLALSTDSLSCTSQYELAIDNTTNERRLFKKQLRHDYKLALRRILELEAAVELINYKIRESQCAPEQHRYNLLQEKVAFLQEIENYKAFVQSEEERINLEVEKEKLTEELLSSQEFSSRVMDGHIQLQKEKAALKHELAAKTKLTDLLEQKLKSLSTSTLSMSSGSSHGSLSTGSRGSLSASSRGSLNSLGLSVNHIDYNSYQNQNTHDYWNQKGYPPIPPIYESSVLHTKGRLQDVQPTMQLATSISSRDSISTSPQSSPPVSPQSLLSSRTVGRYYPARSQGEVSSAEVTELDHVDLVQKPSIDSANSSEPSAYSSYRALSMGSSLGDPQGLAQCVYASKSDESVAADSGVFEASTDGRGSSSTDIWNYDKAGDCQTAQLRVALEYDCQQGKLIVSIEKGRNAQELNIYSDTKQLFVKGSLLPVCSEYNFDFTTRKSMNLAKPVFNDQFLLKILKNKVVNKTLQLDIFGCSSVKGLDYHFGSLQISLADFDRSKDAGFHWYNLLRRSAVPGNDHGLLGNRSNSSVSLDRIKSGDSPANGPDALFPAHLRARSNSWSGDLHASLADSKKVLTKSDLEQRDLYDSFVEMSDLLPDDDFRLERRSSGRRHLVSQVPSFCRDFVRPNMQQQHGSRGGSADGDGSRLQPLHSRSKSDEDASPSAHSKNHLKPTLSHLFRSSSDCTNSTRKFETWSSLARASFERRSLNRRRKSQIAHRQETGASAPTSIDLEMELQSAYLKQTQLDEEITRLKEIKSLMEQAKIEGRATLPDWVTANKQFRQLLKEAGRENTPSLSSFESKSRSKHSSLTRLRKADPKQAQIIGFKEKMVAFSNPKIKVPSNPEVHWV